MIEVSHITKSFDNNFFLDDISFKLERGKTMILIGPSGSGKSTLINCLMTMTPIDSGVILVEGEKMEFRDDYNKVNLFPNITAVFQDEAPWPHLTNRQAIKIILKANNIEFNYLELANELNVHYILDKYPHECSGGELQRINLVKRISLRPNYLLVDEITSALDIEHVRKVENLLIKLKKSGTSLLVSTHSLKFAETIGDCFIFLDKGKIVESGPISEINSPNTSRFKTFLSYNI